MSSLLLALLAFLKSKIRLEALAITAMISIPAFAQRLRQRQIFEEPSSNWFKNQFCPSIRLSRLRAQIGPSYGVMERP
jgi:hypothetical protein